MDSVLLRLETEEREALVRKYRALEASQPEPRSLQDGALFLCDLVDRQGQLTDAGIEAARLLEQSGAFDDLTAARPQPPVEDLLRAELIRDVHALARKAGGLAALKRLVEALME
jgi:hypothetical protein